MKNKFYITTPIYYPNDIPHIGHAYTTLACDIIARWNKLIGKDVLFLTGVDEHGKKIQDTALKKKMSSQEFVDSMTDKFKDAWGKLNIEYSRFIRTTDKDHVENVQNVLQKVYNKGDIYLGEYEGFYCTGCEAYLTEKELENGCCPIHKKKVELMKEKSYFFKITKYKKEILKLLEGNFILPENKKLEMINRVKELDRDLSISRTSFDWGIPLPFDKKHVAYVWFDALLNYYTGALWAKEKMKKDFWPADLHVMAKDIFYFHSVIWPAILMSAEIELPKNIFVHGYWTFDGDKISKSRGKVINIDELISITGNVDSVRYFLFRENVFGKDGDFSQEALIERHNSELLGKWGNLVSRVSGLIEKNGMERCDSGDNSIIQASLEMDKLILDVMKNFQLDRALHFIFEQIDYCNEYISDKKPWETGDKKVLYELANMIKSISILLYPFMPETSKKVAKQFGDYELILEELKKPFDEKSKIVKGKHLFSRV